MGTHFQIIKGKSSTFFNSDGSYTDVLSNNLIEGAWYLTTDTAEVYVALRENPNDIASSVKLKKINNIDIDSEELLNLKSSVQLVENRVTALESAPLGDTDYGEVT